MKKVGLLIVMIFVLGGCDGLHDNYYMEGSVKTLKAKEITNNSAVIEGDINIIFAGNKTEYNIVSQGVRVGTSPGVFDKVVVYSTTGGTGRFSCKVVDLLPNSKYYVRTYVNIKYYGKEDNNFFYGNTIEFTTEN